MSVDLDALVASPHWRWMPGMLTKCGMRIIEGGREYIIGYRSGSTSMGGGIYDGPVWSGILPDIDDPATQGCLLALVRKAYPNTTISHTDGLLICSTNILSPGRIVFFVSGMPLGERLAAALLAAPEPEATP